MGSLLYEGLFSVDASFQAQPLLCSGYTVSEDGLTWTFTLREGIDVYKRPIYTVVALIFIFLGTTMSNDLVWELTDMFNNLMVIPNAIALFALTSVVVRVARREDPDSTPLRR